MDSELVSSSESDSGRGEGVPSPLSFTYTEKFEELCPYYMAIGMSYEQYWDGDCLMTRSYQKAHTLRQEMKNEELWLQGMYIYEALIDVSPALAMMPKQPHPYSSEPYDLGLNKKRTQKRQETAEEKAGKKAKAFMEMFAVNFNKKFEGKEANADG